MKVSELIAELNECPPDAVIEASCQTGCHSEDERGDPIWLEILGIAKYESGWVDEKHQLLILGEVTMA